jgi:hypothetical protein
LSGERGANALSNDRVSGLVSRDEIEDRVVTSNVGTLEVHLDIWKVDSD